MFRSSQPGIARGCTTLLALLVLLLLSACAGTPSAAQATTPQETSSSSGNAPTGGTSFPTAALQLRTPAFGDAGQIAPTVKVLSSADPTLIVQFPLVPASIKQKFPDATALVTVLQDTKANDFDAVTITVAKMPPNVKFTVFFTEIAAKPFGHAEYVGDVFTRSDGSGEATFHLITFVAFAADARQATVQSADQTGAASGIQLEHVGMWFDGVNSARQVLGNSTIAGTPFDGGHGALHAGPQAMTDGQTLPVI